MEHARHHLEIVVGVPEAPVGVLPFGFRGEFGHEEMDGMPATGERTSARSHGDSGASAWNWAETSMLGA